MTIPEQQFCRFFALGPADETAMVDAYVKAFQLAGEDARSVAKRRARKLLERPDVQLEIERCKRRAEIRLAAAQEVHEASAVDEMAAKNRARETAWLTVNEALSTCLEKLRTGKQLSSAEAKMFETAVKAAGLQSQDQNMSFTFVQQGQVESLAERLAALSKKKAEDDGPGIA